MRPLHLVTALALAGCVSLERIAPPVTPALVGASRGVSAAQLEEGRRIFTGACTACHSADPVHARTFAAWREIVTDMAERTKLDAARQSALLAYIAAARATPPAP